MLRRITSSAIRHRFLRALPTSIRHRIIDRYLLAKQREMRAHLAKYGAAWLQALPQSGRLAQAGDSSQRITDYWRTANEGGNHPMAYVRSTALWDIDLIKGALERLLPNRGAVLDFGCNAGRVLHTFAESGWHTVGVEINPQAVATGKKAFPSLERATFYVGDGETTLPQIPPGSIDAIYSTGVLKHVAPDKFAPILTQFARIAPRYIVTMEDEGSFSFQIFPHDYPGTLKQLGYHQIEKRYALDVSDYIEGHGGIGTMFRVHARASM